MAKKKTEDEIPMTEVEALTGFNGFQRGTTRIIPTELADVWIKAGLVAVVGSPDDPIDPSTVEPPEAPTGAPEGAQDTPPED